MSWVVDSPQLVAVDLLSFICHPWSSCSMDIIHWIIIIINPQDSSSWWLWPSIQVKTINSPLQRNSQAVNCQSVTFDRTSSSLLRIFLNGSFHCSYVHFNIMMMMSYLLISLHYCTATNSLTILNIFLSRIKYFFFFKILGKKYRKSIYIHNIFLNT